MPKINLLSDVNPIAVSIVNKGANQQVFYLRKSDHQVLRVDDPTVAPPDADRLIALPQHGIVKSDDWEAVYCVVAEPGALEKAGMIGDQDTPDMWASEDEIRKAAHRFMQNGALINKMHEDLAPYGQVVENFIAPDDFTVDGTTIKKGSWCLGIKPTDEGKAAIDNGDFTGVSLQGSGIRKEAEVDDNETPEALLSKLAKKFGFKVERETPEPVSKAIPDFSTKIAQEELQDELPKAYWALRDVIWGAYDPAVEATNEERKQVIQDSLVQFGEWCSNLLDRVSVEKRAALAKEIGTVEKTDPPKEDVMDQETKDRFEKLEGQMSSLVETVEPVAKRMGEIIEKAEAAKAPTVADLSKQVSDLATGLNAVTENLSKLADGGSQQPEIPDNGEITAEMWKNDPDAALAQALL